MKTPVPSFCHFQQDLSLDAAFDQLGGEVQRRAIERLQLDRSLGELARDPEVPQLDDALVVQQEVHGPRSFERFKTEPMPTTYPPGIDTKMVKHLGCDDES